MVARKRGLMWLLRRKDEKEWEKHIVMVVVLVMMLQLWFVPRQRLGAQRHRLEAVSPRYLDVSVTNDTHHVVFNEL